MPGDRSLLITTNKGIRDWPEVLAGDEILATAILDRLLHHSVHPTNVPELVHVGKVLAVPSDEEIALVVGSQDARLDHIGNILQAVTRLRDVSG